MEIIIAWIDNDKLWKLFYMLKTDSYTEWIYHLYYAMVEKKNDYFAFLNTEEP